MWASEWGIANIKQTYRWKRSNPGILLEVVAKNILRGADKGKVKYLHGKLKSGAASGMGAVNFASPKV